MTILAQTYIIYYYLLNHCKDVTSSYHKSLKLIIQKIPNACLLYEKAVKIIDFLLYGKYKYRKPVKFLWYFRLTVLSRTAENKSSQHAER